MKTVTLGEIANITSGGTPSRKEKSYWGGNIPWVTTSLIQNKTIVADDIEEWITEEGMKKSSAKMVPAGTILMAMYGQGKTRGQVAILDIDATINQACAAISINSDVNRDFVYQQLLYRYDDIRKLSNSGGQENLSSGLIKRIAFPIGSTKEQKKIASILTDTDHAIETTERLIAAKERYLSGLMQKFIQESTWSDVQLKDILFEHGTKSNGLCEVHSVSVSKGILNQIEHLGRSFSASDTSNYNLVKPFDIVYTKSPTGNFPYGIIKQNLLNHDVIVSPLYGVYSPKNEYLGFILHIYFESAIRTLNYLQPIVQKGAKNTISITNQTFLKNYVRIPLDENEQKNVAEILMTAKREIDLLKKLAESYRLQKRGLMQKLLSGEWRVAA